MDELILKAAKIITAVTSIDAGLHALGYDLSRPFRGIRFYWDVLAGVAGVIVLARFFMVM